MKRALLFAVVLSAGCPPSWPPNYDYSITGPCANPYLPVALGNHWDYDTRFTDGTLVSTTAVDVIAIDDKNGRATLRASETRPGRAPVTTSVTLACANGSISRQLATGLPSSIARTTTATIETVPSVAHLEAKSYQWSTPFHGAFQARDALYTVDLQTTQRIAGVQLAQASTQQYRAIEIDRHVHADVVDGGTRDVDSQMFLSPNVGLVRLVGGERIVTLRRFLPRASVSPSAPLPTTIPTAAPRKMNAAGTCTCDVCADVVGPCRPCAFCECNPDSCGCPGQPPCDMARPSLNTDGCTQAGTAGQTGDLCPDISKLKPNMIRADACREFFWVSIVDDIVWLFGGPDANDVCGRNRGISSEWEQVVNTRGDAVGVVGGKPTALACGDMGQDESCPPDDTKECDGVERSPRDNCLTHDDADFELNLRIDPSSPDMRWLAPGNMKKQGSYVGRDIAIEWEYSYMFPPHTDDAGGRTSLPGLLTAGLSSGPLRVPRAGDTLAVSGVVIADCGHDPLRTEFHPPTTIAWLHPLANSPGYFELTWRMSSHATHPAVNAPTFHGTLARTIPLPAGAPSGPVRLASAQPVCDYLYSDWSIDHFDSCKAFVGTAPYACLPVTEGVIAILRLLGDLLTLNWVDLLTIGATIDLITAVTIALIIDQKYEFSKECRQNVSARLERKAGDCRQWRNDFSVAVTGAPGGVAVSLDSLVTAPPDKPELFGGHLDVCVPICNTPGSCGPSTNGCGDCPCSDGQSCDATTKRCVACSSTVCAGKGCGTFYDPACKTNVSCGTCSPPNTCGGGGTPNQCGCTPNCTGKTCGDDGCGGSCGTCTGEQSCGGGCNPTPGRCGGCKGHCCEQRCMPTGTQCP